jgi:hypothetical protein
MVGMTNLLLQHLFVWLSCPAMMVSVLPVTVVDSQGGGIARVVTVRSPGLIYGSIPPVMSSVTECGVSQGMLSGYVIGHGVRRLPGHAPSSNYIHPKKIYVLLLITQHTCT